MHRPTARRSLQPDLDQFLGAAQPDSTERLRRWHDAYPESGRRPATGQAPPAFSRDHAQLLHRARQARSGSTFQALWNAEAQAAPSPSEGDIRLLLMLLYWGGPSMKDQDLDALFRQSSRYRPKWDRDYGGHSYRQRTMQAARRIYGSHQSGLNR